MSRYRILYFCMLSMAVSYYVMDTRYLSWLLLVMILLLVPLEVLLSLPGLLTLRIKLTAEPLSPTQGGVLTARAEVSSRFPVHCVRLRMQCKNLLTGEEADKKGCFPARGGKMAELPCLWEHCGTVCCQVTNARMVDLLGLFSFRVRLPAPVEVLISPTPTHFTGRLPPLRRAAHWRLLHARPARAAKNEALCGNSGMGISCGMCIGSFPPSCKNSSCVRRSRRRSQALCLPFA